MPRSRPPMVPPIQRLKEAGLRVTRPRLAILAALESERWHPTAEQVHGSLQESHPSISLSTVYLALEAFLRSGLVRRVPSREERMRVDASPPDHVHAVCRECSAIVDLDNTRFPLPDPPDRLPGGLEVVGVRMVYDVVCPSCKKGREEGRKEKRRVWLS